MSDVMEWGFVGDLQIPYHDKRAVELFLKAMKWWKPDAIDIVGDIDDQLEYSSFSDGTTDEFFNQLKANQKENDKVLAEYNKQRQKETGEVGMTFVPDDYSPAPINPLPFVKENADGAREFYTQVRKQHPNADIHASLGNHEMRVFSYLDRKAPEIIKEVTPEFLWGLDNLGITWRMYKEPPLERFAGIHVHHGDTTTSTGLAVKNDIENYGISLVRGHDHRGGVVYKSYPMTGRSLAGMGTGHLCDPSAYGLQYTINPAWEQGFGIAHVVDGKAHLQFIPIRGTADGLVCVLDGKVFKN
jgi:hypothetical protein